MKLLLARPKLFDDAFIGFGIRGDALCGQRFFTLPAASLAAIVVLLTISACVSPQSDSPTADASQTFADVVFFGSILTLVDVTDHGDGEAEALAVKGDRIIAVGTRSEIDTYRGEDTKVIDLEDGALLPGFIDAHGHVTHVASFIDFANLASPPVGEIENIAQLQDALRSQAQATENATPSGWIIGTGYDESLLAEGRHPTRDDLDAVSLTRPILVMHVSLHLAVANSVALELAGIDADTPDPKAGVIRRRTGSQIPNGVLEEHAAHAVFGILPPPTPESALAGLEKALAEYAQNGFTTVQDGAASLQGWQLLEAADQAGLLKQDVNAYPIWVVADDFLEQQAQSPANLDRLRLGGIKFVLDGSPQGKTAFLTKPYHVPPDGQDSGYRGYPAFTDQDLAMGIQKYTAKGLPIMAHANGDAAIDQLITALDTLESIHPNSDRRPILIHGQATRLDQLPDLARLGVVPSLFSAHTFFWGDWHRDSVFGAVRGAQISPTASALAEGLPLTIHMDAPVLPPDSMRMIWATVNRRTRSGALLGGHERISVMDAIAATTRTAAYQSFEEKEKGTLEVGKLADLVILDQDPRKVAASDLAEIKIRQTWSHGERIY